MKKILLLLASLPLLASAVTDKYRIVWQEKPESQAILVWNQISGINTQVHYGKLDQGSNAAAYQFTASPSRSDAYKGMQNTSIKLTGLEPDTNYYFVIKDSDSTSPRFFFRTAANTQKPFKFIQGGDSRNGTEVRRLGNRLVAKLRPLFVSFGGDMIASGTDSEWQAWLDHWQETISADGRITPIVPARGNHEAADQIPGIFHLDNADAYYKTVINGELFCQYILNSEIDQSGSQKDWLNNDLSTTKGRYRFLSASYHKPMRPHNSSKSEGTAEYDAWAQIFWDHRFDLLAENDSHCVKRTVRVKPSSAPGSDEGFIADPEGYVMIGEGAWGAPLRTADDDKDWTLDSGSFNSYDLINVYTDRMEIRTIKLDNADAVTSLSELDSVDSLPANIDIWQANGGAIQTITARDRNAYRAFPVENHLQGSTVTLLATTPNNNLLTSIDFYINGQFVAKDSDSSDGWSTSWTTSTIGEYTYHIIANFSDDSTVQSESETFFIYLKNTSNQAFDYQAEWKYYDGSTDPGDWTKRSFDDSSWLAGNGEFGFGEDDENTIINNIAGGVFRKTFSLQSLDADTELTLDYIFNDGIVIYVNGHEVKRQNVTNSSYGSFASSTSSDPELGSVVINKSHLNLSSNIIAISIHNRNATSTDVSFDAKLTSNQFNIWDFKNAPETINLIDRDTEWKYLDNNIEPASDWKSSTYDDSLWLAGEAELGYGDGQTTEIAPGATMSLAYYFRKSFSGTSGIIDATMRVLRDDGVVVYLNGNEVVRDNMPEGAITHTTTAESSVAGDSEKTFFDFTIDPSFILPGENIIAVSVHQRNTSSSDVSFNLELEVTKEHKDTDNDGIEDSLDAFPNDPLEWADTDGDGYGDNADAFPINPGRHENTATINLIGRDTEWKYLDNNVEPTSDWSSPVYDDSSWLSGEAKLGYGDDESTTIRPGETPSIAYYFRKSFPGTDLINDATLHILRDDGAVVYLNGTEIIRDNMPEGLITHTTTATSTTDSDNEHTFFEFTIDPSLILPGENIIAVSVHQRRASSSDVSFNLELSTTVELVDSDEDGFDDIQDTFPNDPAEWADTDGDGYGDNADAFPINPGRHENTVTINLIDRDTKWKYLDNNVEPTNNWKSNSYDDSLWLSGEAELGYGDGQTTEIAPGETTSLAYYFRKSFSGADLINDATLHILRDDGAVVYLNGTEVVRDNMPEGLITHTTTAASTTNKKDEDTFFDFTIDPSLILPGENIIAVSVHQRKASSSDVSFNLELSTTVELTDSDEDGFDDIQDAFPNDPAEWTDTDNDGRGDNSDTNPTSPIHIRTTQAATSLIISGETDQKIIRFDISDAQGSEILESLSIDLASADDLTSLKLYTTTDEIFSTNALLAQVNAPLSTSTFSNLNHTLPEGSSYLWIAGDINNLASEGTIIDASFNAITIDGLSLEASITTPEGQLEVAPKSFYLYDINGDVEEENSYWSVEWHPEPGDIGEEAQWLTDVTQAYSGSRSLKLVNGADESAYTGAARIAWEGNKVSLQEATTYVYFSAWSKAESVTVSDGNYTLLLFADYEDGSSGWGFASDGIYNEGTHGWQQAIGNFNFNKRVIAVTPYVCLFKGSGTVWFDDMQLATSNRGTALETLPYSNNFDASLVDNNSAWKNFINGADSAKWTNSEGNITNGALEIVNTTGTSTIWYGPVIDVPAGHYSITVAAAAKANNVDASGTAFCVRARVTYTDNTASWLYSNQHAFDNNQINWQYAGGLLTAKKEIKTVQPLLVLNGTGTVHFDEVRVSLPQISTLPYDDNIDDAAITLGNWRNHLSDTLNDSASLVNDGKTGDLALLLKNNSGNHTDWRGPEINVEEGVRSISYRAWSRAETPVSTAPSNYFIRLRVVLADGSVIWTYSSKASFTGATDWNTAGDIVHFSQDIKTVQLIAILRNTTGTVYFDDVKIDAVNNELPYNINFDSRPASYGWYTGAGDPQWSETEGINSSGAIKINNNSSTETSMLRSPVIPLNPGISSLRLQASSKAENLIDLSRGDYFARLRVVLSDNSVIWTTPTDAAFTESATWLELDHTFNFDQEVKSFEAMLYFRNASGTVWFDNLKITQGDGNQVAATLVQEGHYGNTDSDITTESSFNKNTYSQRSLLKKLVIGHLKLDHLLFNEIINEEQIIYILLNTTQGEILMKVTSANGFYTEKNEGIITVEVSSQEEVDLVADVEAFFDLYYTNIEVLEILDITIH